MKTAVSLLGFAIAAAAVAYAAQAAAAAPADQIAADPGQQPDTAGGGFTLPDWMKWGAGAAGSPESQQAQTVADWLPSNQSYEPMGQMMDAQSNVDAFLNVIRYAEGTAGANGYRTLFGGSLFDSFDDHPRKPITARLGGKSITSTAAGAYQALSTTWDDFCRARGKHDFSPRSQDEFAVWCIQRRGALDDVKAGRFDQAIAKCRNEWASLPGNGYGQPQKAIADLERVYESNGGTYG